MKTYFATNDLDTLVKIGVSTEPKKRVKNLGGSFKSVKFNLEFFIEGDYEKFLHNHFKEFRVEGEWFNIKVPTEAEIFDILKEHKEEKRKAEINAYHSIYPEWREAISTRNIKRAPNKTFREFILAVWALEAFNGNLTEAESNVLKYLINTFELSVPILTDELLSVNISKAVNISIEAAQNVLLCLVEKNKMKVTPDYFYSLINEWDGSASKPPRNIVGMEFSLTVRYGQESKR